ncbi:MAG: hypothetical protein ABI538_02095 [Pseudoxanthomonas sp.]
MPRSSACKQQAIAVDPQIERTLRLILMGGLVLVLLLPAARGHSDWLGWLPMWLVGMPAVAWWSLYRFRLPIRKDSALESAKSTRRRRPGTQARRRAVPGMRGLPRAA